MGAEPRKLAAGTTPGPRGMGQALKVELSFRVGSDR